METTPLITVVTVVRNGAATREQTMLSVLNQTYPCIEYIIVDGASTDDTVNIIKKYEAQIKEFPNVSFRWISEPDKGIYDAMNKGIDMATGAWINFMNDSDCFYENNTVFKTFRELNADDSIDILYGDHIRNSPFGEKLLKSLPIELIMQRMVFCHQSAFVRTTYMKNVKFDTTFKSSGDYNFFYNSYKNGKKFLYIPIIVAVFSLDSGISSNKLLVLRENAVIHGVQHKISWKFKVIKQYIIEVIKRFIKRILPCNVVSKIQKHNFDKQHIKNHVNNT